MKFDSLREYIDAVKALGELREVDNADWNLEIGAITELVAEKRGSALRFDHIKGYPAGFRVLSNPFSSLKRTALVHGLSMDLSAVDMVKAWRDRMRQLKPVPPVEVKDAPLKENVLLGRDVDLLKLPTPKWHELDGGRYLGTGSCVITRDPDEGWVNLGTYRGMVQDKDLITLKINMGKQAV